MFKELTVESDNPSDVLSKAVELTVNKNKRKIILKNHQSPGDIIMMTAAVRDLVKAHGDEIAVDVRTSCKELWEHNPYLTSLDEKDPTVETIKVDYPLIHKSNEMPYHFIHGFRKDLENKLNLTIPQGEFKGDIHISDDEKGWFSQIREMTGEDIPFWIIVSGGKYDYTAKHYHPGRCQEVVNYFKDRIQFVQCGGKEHSHPALKDVIDLRGKTNLRQIVRLMYHCHGVLCPVTMFMHLAAAVESGPNQRKYRPCVVTAGGREGTQWEMYPWHQYLHTAGMLDCCEHGGCWKSRVVPLGDGDSKDESLCKYPVEAEDRIIIPKCQDMITTQKVIDAIEGYLEYKK